MAVLWFRRQSNLNGIAFLELRRVDEFRFAAASRSISGFPDEAKLSAWTPSDKRRVADLGEALQETLRSECQAHQGITRLEHVPISRITFSANIHFAVVGELRGNRPFAVQLPLLSIDHARRQRWIVVDRHDAAVAFVGFVVEGKARRAGSIAIVLNPTPKRSVLQLPESGVQRFPSWAMTERVVGSELDRFFCRLR